MPHLHQQFCSSIRFTHSQPFNSVLSPTLQQHLHCCYHCVASSKEYFTDTQIIYVRSF